MVVDLTSALGIMSAKNWTATGEFVPKGLALDSQTSRKIGKEHCHDCPVGCSQMKMARTGAYAGVLSEGPDFETIYSFGSNNCIDNIDAVIAV